MRLLESAIPLLLASGALAASLTRVNNYTAVANVQMYVFHLFDYLYQRSSISQVGLCARQRQAKSGRSRRDPLLPIFRPGLLPEQVDPVEAGFRWQRLYHRVAKLSSRMLGCFQQS
jgi:hypothetical protein